MKKILVANPNSNKDLTDLLMQSAKLNIDPTRTELIPFTNPKGSNHIDSVFGDYQSVWSFIRAVLKEIETVKPDALVIAGFGNFGMLALKEALDIPVVSIAEGSQVIATMLGHKYSILTVLKQNIPYQEDLVRLLRFEDKCASVRGIDVNTATAKTSEETFHALKNEIKVMMEEDHCEVVILGGARFATYAKDLTKETGIPVIDPVDVSVKLAETLVELGLSQSKILKFAYPPQKIEDYFVD